MDDNTAWVLILLIISTGIVVIYGIAKSKE